MRVEVAFGGNRPLHAMFKAESHGVDISVRAKVGSWFPAYCALSVRRVTKISVRRRGALWSGNSTNSRASEQGKTRMKTRDRARIRGRARRWKCWRCRKSAAVGVKETLIAEAGGGKSTERRNPHWGVTKDIANSNGNWAAGLCYCMNFILNQGFPQAFGKDFRPASLRWTLRVSMLGCR
jgi:hypothetical protein